ncbi:hypothetical protein BDZ91DRAFT_708265 [Kalaharituber pfeilii]|nr:hypothetical protein BDZ91DRAFT_708265 [Kalaharituber pfeilii]
MQQVGEAGAFSTSAPIPCDHLRVEHHFQGLHMVMSAGERGPEGIGSVVSNFRALEVILAQSWTRAGYRSFVPDAEATVFDEGFETANCFCALGHCFLLDPRMRRFPTRFLMIFPRSVWAGSLPRRRPKQGPFRCIVTGRWTHSGLSDDVS